MAPELKEQENKKKEGTTITQQQKCYLIAVSLFFAILPTHVFLAVSSDIIQIAAVIVPVAIAFMAIMPSIDITFGLPISLDVSEKISERRKAFSDNLVCLLRYGLALVFLTLIAKSLAVWFSDSASVFARIINHFAAWTVGGMVAALLIKVGDVPIIFGYLSVGADIAQYRRRALSQGPSDKNIR